MNLANKLTIARIFMIPMFMVLLTKDFQWGTVDFFGTSIDQAQFIAGWIFIIASFTDFLDGWIARNFDQATSFGAFMDPMADKLLVIAALILIVQFNWAPGWVIVVIISRELMVTGLRVLLAEQSQGILAAAWPGKMKTVTQMLSIIFYLFNDVGFTNFSWSISEILLYISMLLTVYSGAEYFWHGRFVFKTNHE